MKSDSFIQICIKVHLTMKSDRPSLDANRFREDSFHEAFAFSPHNINLEFDVETMKPENHCGAKKQE